MIIEAGGYNLICTESPEGLIISDYEGSGAVLDISSDQRITGIDKKVFFCCRSIRKVYLPESIRFIGDWCFSKCDNLEYFSVRALADGRIFSRGVFDGCTRLKEVVFTDSSPDLAVLLAASVAHMSNDHLLRSDDLGQRFWYEKWDISLFALLGADDGVSSKNIPLGGEEDISNDGIGSVDGEMSGETNEYVKRIATGKCTLCYLRLIHNEHLSEESETKIRAYLKERAYGTVSPWAWIALKENEVNGTDHLQIYLSVVSPDKAAIKDMIADLDPAKVQSKAFLISEAAKMSETASILDDLMI